MRRKTIFLPFILTVFIILLISSVQAQDNNGTFSGNFMFGYRMVNTSGTLFKYKEDINLDDGVRLFAFNLSYTPNGNLKKLFDRVEVNISNLGGDPFETFRISAQKFGTYKFQYDRKKSEYFYYDLYEAGSGALFDLHTFTYDRTVDSGYLKVFLGRNVDFYLSFDRFTKRGTSSTSFDINRVEFEMEKPIQEDSKVVAVGVDFHIKRYSLLLEERIQDYENSNSLFLPGYTDGGFGASYPSALFFFDSNQPYDLKTYTHTAKFNANPFNSLIIAGSAQMSNQTMNLTYSEDAEGINYLGNPFGYSFSGEGSFDRKIQLYDVDITYLLFNRLAVVGAARYHDFNQEGYMVVDFEGQSFREDASVKFNTLSFEGGIQYQVSSNFSLTAGYRYETRNMDNIETATYEFKTRRNGFFGNLKWVLLRNFRLTTDYQRGDYSDPLTLIGPTSFDRVRVTAKFNAHQFDFSGSYLWNKSSSHVFSDIWDSTRNQLSLRAGFHTGSIKLSAGYAYINIKHQGDRTVAYPPSWSGPGGTFLWEILYEGKSSLIDASASISLTENMKIGGYANFYTNKGFWAIARNMAKAYLEYIFPNGLAVQAGYRYVDFKEKDSGYNDYSANIFEISFGYRWK